MLLLLTACDDIRFDLGNEDTAKPDDSVDTIDTSGEDSEPIDTELPEVETGPVFGDTVEVGPADDYVHWTATGDINGDGLADTVGVAQTNWGSGDLTRDYELDIHIPDAMGVFSRQLIPLAHISGLPAVCVLGDLNGDGLDDLVYGHTDGFSVLFSDGETLGAEVGYPGSLVGPLDLGDLDGDGDLDLATLTNDSEVLIYLNDGAGGFTKFLHVSEPSGTVDDQEYNKLILRDVSGDGVLDLLVTAWYTMTEAQVNLGIGDGSFGPAVEGGGLSGVYDLDVADIDADGDLEAVFVSGDNRLDRAEWDDGWTDIGQVDSEKQGSRFAIGDIDGDGDTDAILWQYWVTEVFLQDAGALTWVAAPEIGWWESGVIAQRKARLADVNGDGCDDVVVFVMEGGFQVMPARSEGCDGPTPQAGS